MMAWMLIDKWRSDADYGTAPAFISELWRKESHGTVGSRSSPVCLSPRCSAQAVFSGFRLTGSGRWCSRPRQGPRLWSRWWKRGRNQSCPTVAPSVRTGPDRRGGERERERELPTREFGISVTSNRTIQSLCLNQTWSFSYLNLCSSIMSSSKMDELSLHAASKLLFLAQILWRLDLQDGGLRGCSGSWVSVHLTCVVSVCTIVHKVKTISNLKSHAARSCDLWVVLQKFDTCLNSLSTQIKLSNVWPGELLYLLVSDIISFKIFLFCCRLY